VVVESDNSSVVSVIEESPVVSSVLSEISSGFTLITFSAFG